MNDIVTASERIDQLQASIVELEQQLAAEKSRTTALANELFRVRTALLMCTGAAGIGDSDELCGWIDNVKRQRDEQKARADKAEAAGAEMRNWIERRCKCIAPRSKVLSSDFGTGWLSPEDRATVRAYVNTTAGHLDWNCFRGRPNPKCPKCQILALLDGKEAK